MSANLFKVGTSNAFSTTLNGTITDTSNAITLTTVSGLQYPGVLVLDRVDSNGTATPVTREFISFTGITGSQLTGVSRGLGGSSAQAHNSGAVVEEVWSVSHWNDFLDAFDTAHDSTGKIDGSTPMVPVWVIGGTVSLATTAVGKPLPMPTSGTFQYFSASLRQMASGATLIIDVNKNGASIFESLTRPFIAGGGTFYSTASINTKTFVAGDHFTVDIDSGGGSARDLTVTGRALP